MATAKQLIPSLLMLAAEGGGAGAADRDAARAGHRRHLVRAAGHLPGELQGAPRPVTHLWIFRQASAPYVLLSSAAQPYIPVANIIGTASLQCLTSADSSAGGVQRPARHCGSMTLGAVRLKCTSMAHIII